MRKKLIAGNWKMNMLPKQAADFVSEMKAKVNTDKVDVVFCVPSIYLQWALGELKDTNIQVGAQNMHYMEGGAYTGEISAPMLSGLGVPFAIIGHSERREYFNESDTTVNLKSQQALKHGISPIICIGETLKQRQANRTLEVIGKQLSIATDGMKAEDIKKIVIAYEPIWAIGTGLTATSEQAEEVCAMIREQLSARYGASAADAVRILYGGSVNAKNSAELFSMPNIDGGLVGGASIVPDFEKVVHFG